MSPHAQRQLQYHLQLEAARELVALVQLGMLQSLPMMRWHIAPATITATPADDASDVAVPAWAEALEADLTEEDGTAIATTTRGHLGSVTVVVTTGTPAGTA